MYVPAAAVVVVFKMHDISSNTQKSPRRHTMHIMYNIKHLNGLFA